MNTKLCLLNRHATLKWNYVKEGTHDADGSLPPLLHDLLAVLHGPGLVVREGRDGVSLGVAPVTPRPPLRGHLGVQAEHVTELRDLTHPALQHGAPAVSATGANINTGSIFAKLPPLQLTTKTRGRKLASNEGCIFARL